MICNLGSGGGLSVRKGYVRPRSVRRFRGDFGLSQTSAGAVRRSDKNADRLTCR
eukprot:SAG31_NODE_5326_length_2609_cov_1.490837_1_plen_54_part_00